MNRPPIVILPVMEYEQEMKKGSLKMTVSNVPVPGTLETAVIKL